MGWSEMRLTYMDEKYGRIDLDTQTQDVCKGRVFDVPDKAKWLASHPWPKDVDGEYPVFNRDADKVFGEIMGTFAVDGLPATLLLATGPGFRQSPTSYSLAYYHHTEDEMYSLSGRIPADSLDFSSSERLMGTLRSELESQGHTVGEWEPAPEVEREKMASSPGDRFSKAVASGRVAPMGDVDLPSVDSVELERLFSRYDHIGIQAVPVGPLPSESASYIDVRPVHAAYTHMLDGMPHDAEGNYVPSLDDETKDILAQMREDVRSRSGRPWEERFDEVLRELGVGDDHDGPDGADAGDMGDDDDGFSL